MRDCKYYSGETELTAVFPIKNEQFTAMGGVKSKHNWYDSFSRLAGSAEDSGVMPVTRRIDYKSVNPSLHKCDARCTNAKGHNCECSCGGKNHGINQ